MEKLTAEKLLAEAGIEKIPPKKIVSELINRLQDTKTEEDLEAASDLADEAVLMGALTNKNVVEIWDDFAPSLF